MAKKGRRAQLRELQEQLNAVKKHRRECEIEYYTAASSQAEAFHASKAHIRAIFGGNRAGKSEAGAAEVALIATGRKKGVAVPNKGRIICVDFEKGFMQVINPKLERWIPKAELAKTRKNRDGIPVHWTLKNGSEFDVMSLRQDAEQFEGGDFDWAWVDEPCPEHIFTATTRGLVDSHGIIWLTLTPIREPWMLDRLWLARASDPDIECWQLSIYDNKFQTPAAIAAFVKTIPVDERPTRVEGQFLRLAGTIYKFVPEVHRIRAERIPEDLTYYVGIDPGMRVTGVVWLGVDAEDNWFIVDELRMRECTVKEVADAIKAKNKGRNVQRYIIDPAAKQRTQTTKESVREHYEREGIPVDLGVNDVNAGILAVKKSMAIDSGKLRLDGSGRGAPQLYISERCGWTIWEMLRYIWKNVTSRAQQDVDRPVKRDDHLMDALRYVVLDRPTYVASSQPAAVGTFRHYKQQVALLRGIHDGTAN